MAKICGKWRIYFGIGLSVWETAKFFAKWRGSVGNVSNMWGNDWIIFKLLKNVVNDLEIWEMAKIFGKWLRCMGHGLSIWETA